MRALVIEDDAAVADFLMCGLREAGFAVDHSADGSEGLELTGTKHHDVIVLDRMLPGLNGFEVL